LLPSQIGGPLSEVILKGGEKTTRRVGGGGGTRMGGKGVGGGKKREKIGPAKGHQSLEKTGWGRDSSADFSKLMVL